MPHKGGDRSRYTPPGAWRRGGGGVGGKGALSVVVGDRPDIVRALETAASRRPELSDLRNRQGVARELLAIARAGNRPRLDFRGALGRQEIDYGVVDVGGNTWSAGGFACWPPFGGLRPRGRVAQAGSDVRTLRIEGEQLLDAIA